MVVSAADRLCDDCQGGLTVRVSGCPVYRPGVPTPDDLETQVTLRTAVRRYDELRYRDSLVDNPGGARRPGIAEPLSRAEALELVALSEVIARKAGHGRQLAVRTARATGASWAQIGEALGTSRQSAWEAHTRWIDHHAHRHHTTGYEGFDETEATQARALAGRPDEGERR